MTSFISLLFTCIGSLLSPQKHIFNMKLEEGKRENTVSNMRQHFFLIETTFSFYVMVPEGLIHSLGADEGGLWEAEKL